MNGFAIWLTGLPASGKSTLAHATANRLQADGLRVQILDSDELRTVLTPQPTYSAQERDWFYSAVAYIGKLLAQNGVNVLFAATAAKQHYRDRARRMINHFAEVYVRCPLETCKARDPKGLYARAQAGEIDNLPGVQVPYEAPENAVSVIDTDALTAEQGAQKLIEHLKQSSFLD